MLLSCSLYCREKGGGHQHPEVEGAAAEVRYNLGRCKGKMEALPLTEHQVCARLVPGLVHADFICAVDWVNPTSQIKELRFRERMSHRGGGGEPQPKLSGSSPSPSFLFFHHCTAPQGQGSPCGAVRLGQWPGPGGLRGRGGQEWKSWKGPQGVCPETQGEHGA